MAAVTTEQKRRLQEQGAGVLETFPTLRITADDLIPEGAFAVAQATYLNPNTKTVEELNKLLTDKKVGVVSHFYMGPELQGVLASCTWEHVFCADSLAMGDAAINMAKNGCEAVVVLGVDFMSENCRALMDANGCKHVPVYRVQTEEIGCSLAESADKPAYGKYLERASSVPNSLHVVYINTGLLTKAKAHALVPTITCTSSNVVRLILTAYHQLEGVSVFFGPDTYMGRNLKTLFTTMATMDDESIKKVHPEHDQKSIKALLEKFEYFEEGNCVVHEMFGDDVAKKIRKLYPDANVTAHLEVPGAMFGVAIERQLEGKGVAGATSDILNFILNTTEKALKVAATGDKNTPATRLEFVLGTEAGMITPIVRKVQKLLKDFKTANPDAAVVECDIIFPVASEAITTESETGLTIVPGTGGGEGCSAAGGCATCPYMKMNSLDALMDVVRRIGGGDSLEGLYPQQYTQMVRKRTAADMGSESILHMRSFQQNKALSAELAEDVKTRAACPSKLRWVVNEGLDW